MFLAWRAHLAGTPHLHTAAFGGVCIICCACLACNVKGLKHAAWHRFAGVTCVADGCVTSVSSSWS